MKRIVILGGSAAGVKAIEEIRNGDSSSEITLIAFDGHYPYKRDAFAPFIAKSISPEDVFYRSKSFYEQHKVNVVLDKKISRINVRRKRIFTEDKEQIDYDILIMTDTPENRFPDIKGTGKTGVFGYKKLKDIDQMVNGLPLVETVAIQSDSFSGLQAAVAFAGRGKEVILISSGKDFLAGHFEPEAAQWLVCRFEERGLRIIRPGQIAEILGDKDAKAVRLGSGKVFAAQAILFGETDEDLRLFPDSGLRMNKKVDVDCRFKANIDGIFVVDQACSLSGPEPVTPLPILEEQGKTVAAAINGQQRSSRIPACSWDLNMDGLSITVLGHTEAKEGIKVCRTFDRGSGRYKELSIEDRCLVGAVLVNAGSEKDRFLRLIDARTNIEAAAEACFADEPPDSRGSTAKVSVEDVSPELVDN